MPRLETKASLRSKVVQRNGLATAGRLERRCRVVPPCSAICAEDGQYTWTGRSVANTMAEYSHLTSLSAGRISTQRTGQKAKILTS